MNTGQTMLAVGAMMLLSFLVLRFNSVHITSAQASYNAKFGIVATSLANSLIEEAKDKAFDELVLDTTKTILSANDFSKLQTRKLERYIRILMTLMTITIYFIWTLYHLKTLKQVYQLSSKYVQKLIM